jgi:hypothetical protein
VSHPSEEEVEEVVKRIVQVPEYLIATLRLEQGAEGTPHLQGFAVFLHEMSRRTMERTLGGRAHLEMMKGRVAQNSAYCQKEGSVIAEKGAEETKTRTASRAEMWAEVLEGAKTMTPEEFQGGPPEQWMIRKNPVERMMIEAMMKRSFTERKRLAVGRAGPRKKPVGCITNDGTVSIP